MRRTLTCALFLLVSLLGADVYAVLIPIQGGIASHYFADRSPMQAFDGTGLNSPADPNDPTAYENSGGANNFGQQENWLADARTANGQPPIGDHWIGFDLGSATTVEVMNVFNFGVSTQERNTRGADEVNIYYRADGSFGNNADLNNTAFDDSGWTLLTAANLSIGSIADTTGPVGPDAFDFGGASVSNIAIDVISNHGDESFVGIGEVQFFNNAPVPEPGAFSLVLLLGMGLLPLLRSKD